MPKARKRTLVESLAGEQKTGESCVVDLGDKSGSVITHSTRIRTAEDALKKAGIDTAIWVIDRQKINSWEVAAWDSESKEFRVQPLWQVSLTLKRLVTKPLETGLRALFASLPHAKRQTRKSGLSMRRTNSTLLEISLFDAHFGKLAWGPETGTDYDTDIAATVYQNAIDDLLDRSRGMKVGKILFPVGSDFFHVNNWQGTTANGTEQDLDTRFARVFELGTLSVVRAINSCRVVAPVELVWVPGNHDRETSYYLVRVLAAHFRADRGVDVDLSPKHRKYVLHGTNLIGFTHGDQEKHRDLPSIMAAEVPDLWAKATCREFHLGHYHKAKQTVHTTTDEFGGVRVRVLPSLSGTDAWHYRQGYVGTKRAAEAYLWDSKEGYVGHLSVNCREG